jgi:TetR/AcrR family transcriptional regulator
VPGSTRERVRDAERSRKAILAAAERLFAERGYEGTSLVEIGAAAGLSRGAPSYFFGSKEQLHGDVLAAVFEQRQEATERAFEGVREWAAGEGDAEDLRRALSDAADGYLRYLDEHPAFVALIMREELAGGRRLPAASSSSTAMQDAFRALRRAGSARGVRSFRVEQAVLVFVSLTFAPVSYRRTLLRAVDLDLGVERERRRQARLTADQLMQLLAG